MSVVQKIIGAAGILEIAAAAINVFCAIHDATGAWGNAGFCLFTGIALLSAAKDVTKIQPAWLLALIALVLGVLVTALALTNKSDMLTAEIIALVISAVVFLATNSARKVALK